LHGLRRCNGGGLPPKAALARERSFKGSQAEMSSTFYLNDTRISRHMGLVTTNPPGADRHCMNHPWLTTSD
jgi:hypothetical protein